jgi:hypothetical protein
MQTIIAKNCKIFEILLGNPAKQNHALLTSRNNEGNTPLHLFHNIMPKNNSSSEYSNKFINSTLYSLLYGIDDKESKRTNPIEHKNYVDTFFQLAFSQEINQDQTIKVIDAVNEINGGFTPLHLAVLNKCSHCIQRLLKYGASFHIKLVSKSIVLFCIPSS